MGIVVKISSKSKPEDTRKVLDKLAKSRKKNKKKLADFYGKMLRTYGNGLEYQKKVRNEWP